MKIKRFEADNMADALRMIRKEFGGEAVILSAKSVKKPGGVLSTKKNRQVVVTAAIDRTVSPAGHGGTGESQGGPFAQRTHADELPEKDGGAKAGNSLLHRIMPITRTGRQKLRSKFVRLETQAQQPAYSCSRPSNPLRQHLAQAGLCAAIAEELVNKVALLVSSEESSATEWRAALSEVISAKKWVTPLRPAHKDHASIVVFVGPPGVGKTTAAAKLAAEATLQGQRAVLLSVDNHRVAGSAQLKRYAEIIGIPLHTTDKPHQIMQMLEQHADAGLIIVDTPGLSPQDEDRREKLTLLLAGMKNREVHLLVNAAAQEKAMEKALAYFKPIGVDRLFFTQMDWAEDMGPLLKLLDRSELPVAYISDGPQVPEGIKPATAEWITHLLWPLQEETENLAAAMVVQKRKESAPDTEFVANRNSDIFHRRSCRAVQRINTDNIVIFASPVEALGQDFKPCRMCCSDLSVSHNFDRLAGHPLASNRSYAR